MAEESKDQKFLFVWSGVFSGEKYKHGTAFVIASTTQEAIDQLVSLRCSDILSEKSGQTPVFRLGKWVYPKIMLDDKPVVFLSELEAFEYELKTKFPHFVPVNEFNPLEKVIYYFGGD